MPKKNASWMDEEEARANQTAATGETSNPEAPQLARVMKEPARKQKAFYLQQSYIDAFDLLAFNEKKKVKGNPAPKLAEEALRLLFERYGVDTTKL